MKSDLLQKAGTGILRRTGAALGAIALMGSLVTTSALAAECTTTAAIVPQKVKSPSSIQTAKHVRRLQSELMVAALGCGHRSQYNAFARSYRSDLKRNGKRLKSHFQSEHALNRYVTALANEASMAMAANADYCEQTGLAFDYLLSDAETGMGLEQLAVQYALTQRDLGKLAAAEGCEETAQISSR